MSKHILSLILLAPLLLLCGCTKMESREYGVRFWKAPSWLGGGVSKRVFAPGEVAIDFPLLAELYTFDTGVREVSWGSDNVEPLHTRAHDGNEVALAITVSYRIQPSAKELVALVMRVGTSNTEIERFVRLSSEAFIRTYSNELRSAEYINDRSRYETMDRVRQELQGWMKPFGIDVLRLSLDRFRFDDDYEGMLNEIQRQMEETEREKARIATVVAQKEQEMNNMRAKVNQILEEAKGFRSQSQTRADNYFLAKSNEASGILAAGQASAEGLQKKIAALAGPGGRELVKIELAKEIAKGEPKYFVMEGEKDTQGVSVRRLDSNVILQQLGLMEAERASTPSVVDRSSESSKNITNKGNLK